MLNHLYRWAVVGFIVVATAILAVPNYAFAEDTSSVDSTSNSTVQTVVAQEAPAITLDLGESSALNSTLLSDYITQTTLYWISEDPTIATVDETGKVVARNTGETRILCQDGVGQTLTISPVVVTAVVSADYQGNIGPILDGLDLEGISKVMIVAHPDDETLWGGAHIYEGGWLVVCLSNLTYFDGVRSAEFAAAMNAFGTVGIILDYPAYDPWDNAMTTTNITADVTTLLGYEGVQWEQVATHNPNGEYGQSLRHHRSANAIVTSVYDVIFPNEDNLYYFGRHYHSQESIDALPPLTKIDLGAAEVKDDILWNIYVSQNLSGHIQMFPYENWVKRSDWNDDGTHSAIEIFGVTRIETAVAIAEEAYPDGSQGVIITTGYDFPDALASSSLAGMLGYPILLTDPVSLNPAVMDEIITLGVEKVIIVGGTDSVSPPGFY